MKRITVIFTLIIALIVTGTGCTNQMPAMSVPFSEPSGISSVPPSGPSPTPEPFDYESAYIKAQVYANWIEDSMAEPDIDMYKAQYVLVDGQECIEFELVFNVPDISSEREFVRCGVFSDEFTEDMADQDKLIFSDISGAYGLKIDSLSAEGNALTYELDIEKIVTDSLEINKAKEYYNWMCTCVEDGTDILLYKAQSVLVDWQLYIEFELVFNYPESGDNEREFIRCGKFSSEFTEEMADEDKLIFTDANGMFGLKMDALSADGGELWYDLDVDEITSE